MHLCIFLFYFIYRFSLLQHFLLFLFSGFYIILSLLLHFMHFQFSFISCFCLIHHIVLLCFFYLRYAFFSCSLFLFQLYFWNHFILISHLFLTLCFFTFTSLYAFSHLSTFVKCNIIFCSISLWHNFTVFSLYSFSASHHFDLFLFYIN